LDLAEILLAQTVQGGAIHLRGAAHEVMHPGLEGFAVLVVPGVLGNVTVLDEHFLGVPVLGLARHPAAALEQQDLLAGRRQVVGRGAAARAAADDDHVVGRGHRLLSFMGAIESRVLSWRLLLARRWTSHEHRRGTRLQSVSVLAGRQGRWWFAEALAV